MAKTLTLPCTRFVRQVSNGASRSKYAFTAMQAENAEAIRTASWRVADVAARTVSLTVNQLTATDGESDAETGEWTKLPSYTVYMKDRYDAFKQAGDAVERMATMCGYAGCAAYRFELARSTDMAIDAVELMVSRDRYCRSGVRVVCVLSDDLRPSDDWAVVRGETDGAIVTRHEPVEGVQGVTSRGWLDQVDEPYVLTGRSAEGRVTFSRGDFPALENSDGRMYLWVYVTLEDYADYWTQYSPTERRTDYIEGSAMLVSQACRVTFRDDEAVLYADGVPVSAQTLPNGPNVAGDGNLDRVNAFGNFCQVHMRSAVFLPNGCDRDTPQSATPWATVIGMLDSMQHRPLVKVWDHGSGTFPVDMSEVGVFGGQFLRHSIGQGGTIPGYDLRGVFGVSAAMPGKASTYSVAGVVTDPIRLELGYCAVVAPAGAQSYGEMALVAHVRDAMYSNAEVGVNVWKSSSPDLVGMWGAAAFAAIGQNPALFTGSATSVSGSMEGDGTLTSGLIVTASAELVGYVDLAGWADRADAASPMTLRIPLSTPVRPGEVVILTPRLLSLRVDSESVRSESRTNYASFTMPTYSFRFYV